MPGHTRHPNLKGGLLRVFEHIWVTDKHSGKSGVSRKGLAQMEGQSTVVYSVTLGNIIFIDLV